MGTARAGSMHEQLVVDILSRAKHHPSTPIKRAINVEYRLTRAKPLFEPANAFPAALLDGLAVVYYLIYEVGFHPRNILLSGDSAGGNLALGLTRYLRDAPPPVSRSRGSVHKSTVGLGLDEVISLTPGGLVLLSPWCDVASTHIPERAGPNCSFVRNAGTDVVGRYRRFTFFIVLTSHFRYHKACFLTNVFCL